ncbi:hypothetical protein ABKN59_011248 [Abortiporus biennis]
MNDIDGASGETVWTILQNPIFGPDAKTPQLVTIDSIRLIKSSDFGVHYAVCFCIAQNSWQIRVLLFP